MAAAGHPRAASTTIAAAGAAAEAAGACYLCRRRAGRQREHARVVAGAGVKRWYRLAVLGCLGLFALSSQRQLALAAGGAAASDFVPARARAVATPRQRVSFRGSTLALRAEGGAESSAEEAAAKAAEMAALRARLAELELAGAASRPATDVGAVPGKFGLADIFAKIKEELPELADVEKARLGVTPDNQYVFQAGDASKKNPIYKRKDEVLGMTVNQQANYMRAFRKCVKLAKKLDSVMELNKLMGENKRNEDFRSEMEALRKRDKMAIIFFRDVLPEATADPIADTLIGLASTAAIVGVTLLFCLCLFPPQIPTED